MAVPMEYQSVIQTDPPDGTCSNTFMEILFWISDLDTEISISKKKKGFGESLFIESLLVSTCHQTQEYVCDDGGSSYLVVPVTLSLMKRK